MVRKVKPKFQKGWPGYSLITERRDRSKDINRLKVKRWKKIFYANDNPRRAGVAY